MSSLLRSAGFDARTFERTSTLNASEKPDRPSCLLLDVRLRGESGLYFQQKATQVHRMPFIFMTGFADISSCVRAMKAGAWDFLLKPLVDLNKQIAAEPGISDITVKVHRAAAMRKMRATSLADIVRKADLIGLTPDSDDRLPNHFVLNRRINDM